MFPKFKLNHRTLKTVINLTFLSLSCFLIVYFLIQLTDNPIIKLGFSLFAIILEVFMQYLLSAGRAKWRIDLKFQAGILFFLYGLYVFVYAIPSAMGFFMAEINTQEQMAARQEIVEDTSRQRLTQIDTTIKNLNAQLATESKSGYGRKSQLIMTELKQLTVEQADIQNRFQNNVVKKTPAPRDTFKVLGEVLKISSNTLKILIFGISVLMVYVGLIITSWDIEMSESSKIGKNQISEASAIFPPIATNRIEILNAEVGKSFGALDNPSYPTREEQHFQFNHGKSAHRNKSPTKGPTKGIN